MEVKFSHGAILHRLNYGVVEKDVSDVAHQYLNYNVVFDDGGITVGDVYELLAKDPILQAVYRRNFSSEFLEYLATIPEKKRRAIYEKKQKKPNAIEFIELKRIYTYDDVNQIFNINSGGIISLTAMSKVLNRSYDGFKKGQRINYSATGIDIAKIYYIPIKYETLAIATQENRESAKPANRKEFSQVKEFIVPQLTLNELIESVTWELSFYGSPKKAKETFEELKGNLAEVKEKNDITKEAKRILEVVSSLIFTEKNEVAIVLVSTQNKELTFEEASNKFLEMGEISIASKFTGEKKEMFKRFIANAIESEVNEQDTPVDVDYLLAISEGNYDSRIKEVKRFELLVPKVQEKLANDVPEDDAHAERNQIVVNKIAETQETIKKNSFIQKELIFINKELEDVMKDIDNKRVNEVFIHIDRINENLNKDFSNSYNENFFGFSKLPESLDKDKKKKLSTVIDALPNEVLMKDFVDVMFQNSASLKDDFLELNAYDYRLRTKLGKNNCLFNVHDNKALEKKEALSYQRYAEKYIEENTQTEEAKRITLEGKSMFESDVDVKMKAIHKLVAEIRPDVSLIRWKTITPQKPKLKKAK